MNAKFQTKFLKKGLLCSLLLFTGFLQESSPVLADQVKALTVMTQNLYDGTDRTGLLEAATFPEFVAAVDSIYSNLLATKPIDRLTLIAKEIAANKVDVVGLQEAAIWRIGISTAPANTAKFDYIQILLNELQKLNQSYFVVAVLPGFDVQLPGSNQYIRLTDRDVIIARKDLIARGYQFTNLQVQDYLSNETYTVPVLNNAQVSERSGWASFDLVTDELKTRIVTTHLNFNPRFDPTIATAQAKELLSSVSQSNLRTVLLGDFNSNANNIADPTFATYDVILHEGYNDTWTLVNGNSAGLTCCQNEDLANTVSNLAVRYDLILINRLKPLNVKIVGNQQSSSLWPSDHAGVIAIVQ